MICILHCVPIHWTFWCSMDEGPRLEALGFIVWCPWLIYLKPAPIHPLTHDRLPILHYPSPPILLAAGTRITCRVMDLGAYKNSRNPVVQPSKCWVTCWILTAVSEGFAIPCIYCSAILPPGFSRMDSCNPSFLCWTWIYLLRRDLQPLVLILNSSHTTQVSLSSRRYALWATSYLALFSGGVWVLSKVFSFLLRLC